MLRAHLCSHVLAVLTVLTLGGAGGIRTRAKVQAFFAVASLPMPIIDPMISIASAGVVIGLRKSGIDEVPSQSCGRWAVTVARPARASPLNPAQALLRFGEGLVQRGAEEGAGRVFQIGEPFAQQGARGGAGGGL